MRLETLEAFSYRADPAVPSFPDDRPILIFDGHCVLCSSFVRFILRTDKNRHFRLMSAQSRLENFCTVISASIPWTMKAIS